MQTNTNAKLAWHAPTRVHHERSQRWYAIAGGLSLIPIIYGLMTGAWSLSLTFALVTGLYYLTKDERPHDHSIAILESGISFDGRLQPWSDLSEFWILQAPGYYELRIAHRKTYKRDLVIQTGSVDPFVVRDILGQYLPQVAHHQERMLDTIIRFCKL